MIFELSSFSFRIVDDRLAFSSTWLSFAYVAEPIYFASVTGAQDDAMRVYMSARCELFKRDFLVIYFYVTRIETSTASHIV